MEKEKDNQQMGHGNHYNNTIQYFQNQLKVHHI